MVDIIFTKFDEKGEISSCMKVGSVQSVETAEEKMTSMFVNFCRDVSKKPLERRHFANGFEWMYHGLKHQLNYISEEVN